MKIFMQFFNENFINKLNMFLLIVSISILAFLVLLALVSSILMNFLLI